MTPETQQQVDADIQAAYQRGVTDGYLRAKTEWLLKASDEINGILNRALFSSRDVLQGWANELGRTLHTAVPDVDVKPLNQKSE